MSWKPGVDRIGIAELGSDMAKVDASDISHLLAAGTLGGVKRFDEPLDVRVVDRVNPPHEKILE